MGLIREGRQRIYTWLAMIVACTMVTACAHHVDRNAPASPHAQPPLIQLSPASLGQTISEQQRLTISGPSGQPVSLDALLEVDNRTVRLAFVQVGRVMARLEWDGVSLTTTQAAQWPEEVSAQRILADLQLARWPVQAVQSALPEGWSLVVSDGTRHLRHGGEDVMRLATDLDDTTEIRYLQSGWRLTIQTHATGSSSRVSP